MVLLIHVSLKFSPFSFSFSNSVEVIGGTIVTEDLGKIDVFSVYVPNEGFDVGELKPIFNSPDHFVVASDFNAHHPILESVCTANRCGNFIADLIVNHSQATLVTPKDLGTQVDPASGKISTIDLCLMTTQLALGLSVSLGPYMGSDHLSVKFPVLVNPTCIGSRLQDGSLKIQSGHYGMRSCQLPSQRQDSWNRQIQLMPLSPLRTA